MRGVSFYRSIPASKRGSKVISSQIVDLGNEPQSLLEAQKDRPPNVKGLGGKSKHFLGSIHAKTLNLNLITYLDLIANL